MNDSELQKDLILGKQLRYAQWLEHVKAIADQYQMTVPDVLKAFYLLSYNQEPNIRSLFWFDSNDFIEQAKKENKF